jgi:hypothetical protein
LSHLSALPIFIDLHLSKFNLCRIWFPPDRSEYPDILPDSPDFPEYPEKYPETPDLNLTTVKKLWFFRFDYSPPPLVDILILSSTVGGTEAATTTAKTEAGVRRLTPRGPRAFGVNVLVKAPPTRYRALTTVTKYDKRPTRAFGSRTTVSAATTVGRPAIFSSSRASRCTLPTQHVLDSSTSPGGGSTAGLNSEGKRRLLDDPSFSV